MQGRLGAARRIQAFLSKFLSTIRPDLTDCFRSRGFAVDSYVTAYKPSPNLSFSSFIWYLTFEPVLHLPTLLITNVSSEEEPRHFLIYHYITARKPMKTFTLVHSQGLRPHQTMKVVRCSVIFTSTKPYGVYNS